MSTFSELATLQSVATWTLAGGFALMVTLEIARPRQGMLPLVARLRHGAHNLVLWLFGIALLSLLFGLSGWYLMVWMAWQHVGVLYLVRMPPWMHALLAFLLLDFLDYAYHRLSHRVRWLWLMHAVHHSDVAVDATTNLRQHPLHVLCTQAWKLVAAAAIGAPLWLFLLREITIIALAHFHHAAVRWPAWIDRVFAQVLITPRAHWIHHSMSEQETNSNYGLTLSVWDRLCGTYRDPRSEGNRFGLSALQAHSWHTAWGMLATPVRARTIDPL